MSLTVEIMMCTFSCFEMMKTLVTPFLLAAAATISFVSSMTPISQINALHSLYSQTDGENWLWRNESSAGAVWSFNSTSEAQEDPCNSGGMLWQGITCSSIPTRCQTTTCNIVAIDLGLYGLAGPLPSDLFSIVSLTSLVLDRNSLSGTIPTSIGSLSQLQYFWINRNQISGPIPSSVGSLSQLQHFWISSNFISGDIPSSIGSLSLLVYFWIYNNRISGTIPSALGSLSLLEDFDVSLNRIFGTIPSSIGSLFQLHSYWSSFNHITGVIPSSTGSISRLQNFDLFENQVSGPIPFSVGSLVQLEYFDVSNNQINGSIPGSIGSLSLLQYFEIYNNRITGTLPSSIGSLSQLQYLLANDNQLRGTIPSSIGSLSQLQHFIMFKNQITGTIPASVGTASRLQYFDFSSNQLVGAIPSSVGLLSELQYFDISRNAISGTIHSSFNVLSTLVVFSAYSNHLTGPIPLQLSSLSILAQLFLHENRLTGSLDHFLLDYHPSFNQSGLINLDVSGNALTGTIPDNLFLIPSLDSIALSVNCFEGKLPVSICDAVNVSVMSLDGLRASTSCEKQSTVPFTSVSLDRMMEGSIPDCVWRLSNLDTLHLAGNGFRGRIGDGGETRTTESSSWYSNSNSNSTTMPRLVDLTLSHNYLSGEIPVWLLEKKNMRSLDLSHNKLTGDLDRLISKDDTSDGSGSVSGRKILKLGVNRLSGRLPSSMDAYSTLDILSGNLFSCATVPADDENSEYYVCGSSEYNQSMVVLGGVMCVLMVFILSYFFMAMMSRARCGPITDHHASCNSAFCLSWLISSVRRWSENKKLLYHKLVQYLRYSHHHFVSSRRVNETERIFLLIMQFGKTLVGVERLFLITTTTIIVFSVPLYVLKDVGDHSYVTRYHQYQWHFTLSYFSGAVPGLLLMILCLISLLVFRFTLWCLTGVINHGAMGSGVVQVESSSLNSLHILESNEEERHLAPMSSVDQDDTLNHHTQSLGIRGKVYLCVIFLVNMVMVGTVNGLYIWSTVQKLSRGSRLLIQLSVSFFGMIWRSFVRWIFPNQLKHSFSVVWLLGLIGVINGLLIPCVVTSLTSPSCYQRLIIEPEDISSTYTYTYCSVWLAAFDLRCLVYESASMNVPPMTPPFTYSYQCGSTILTSYIPVNLYSTVFAIIIEILRLVIVFQTKYEDYPRVILESPFLPHRDLNSTRVLSTVVNNMILLLSFGLSSPVLCFGICLSSVISVSSHLMRLGRLVFRYHGGFEEGINHTTINSNTNTMTSARSTMHNNSEIILEVEIRETRSSVKTEDIPGDGVPIDVNSKANVDQEVRLMEKSFAEMTGCLKDGLRCVERCKWLIMAPSCLFMTVLSWDIAGDEERWDGSYWIPLMGVGMMVTVYVWDYGLMKTTIGKTALDRIVSRTCLCGPANVVGGDAQVE